MGKAKAVYRLNVSTHTHNVYTHTIARAAAAGAALCARTLWLGVQF